jgi:hypothetical protein
MFRMRFRGQCFPDLPIRADAAGVLVRDTFTFEQLGEDILLLAEHRYDLLDGDVVNPVITYIIDVFELGTSLQIERAQLDTGGVLVLSLLVGRFELPVPDVELIKMMIEASEK